MKKANEPVKDIHGNVLKDPCEGITLIRWHYEPVKNKIEWHEITGHLEFIEREHAVDLAKSWAFQITEKPQDTEVVSEPVHDIFDVAEG